MNTSTPRYSKFVVYLPADEASEFMKCLQAEARKQGITRSEIIRKAFWKAHKKINKAAA